MNMTVDMVIIGGGLSGLLTAYHAKKAGKTVLLLESAGRLGGVVRSERVEGYLLEYGPSTVMMKPELYHLIRDLGLQKDMLLASPRTPRFVLFNKTLRAVPMSPLSLATSRLLSWRGKARLLKEPFVPSRSGTGEETLLAFSRRRFGSEAAERLVTPFVSGVWAGDPAQLSVSASFPRLAEWENQQGSVIKGALFGPKKNGGSSPRGLVSFTSGLEMLTRRLRDDLGLAVRTGVRADALRRDGDGWTISAGPENWRARDVALCSPAPAAAQLISGFAPTTADALRAIPYAPLAVVHLGFEENQMDQPRDGFGYLTAPSEHADILGCLWSSKLFPDRAPAGRLLLTAFMGGMTNPALLTLTDEALIRKAVESVRPVMKLKGDPVFARLTRYERAIPQYTLGHSDRMKMLAQTEQQQPGLMFVANYRGGIAVSDVVSSAARVRDAI